MPITLPMHERRKLPLWWCGLLPVCLVACTVGPDAKTPEQKMPAHYAGAAMAPTDDAALAQWWTGFDDPTLNDLVARALRDNLDLQTAVSRIREAREQEIVAGAAAWPTLSADPSFTHTQLSRNAISLGGLGALTGGAASGGSSSSAAAFGFPGTSFNTYQLGLDASWQLDLFGRTRRSVEAAHDTMLANVWNSRDTQVSMVAELADAYFALRTAQRRLAIAQHDLDRQRALLDLLRTRAHAGLATELDVRQQETTVAATEAGLPPLSADVAVQAHALGVLLGEPPEAVLDTLRPGPLPTAPIIPVGLPADLLRRRPDIRAAERQFAAATANIGVAVADYYPDITLTALPALVSTALSNLLTWGSRNLTASAGLTWNLFDGGRVKANVAVMDERAKQALLTYHKTVLVALRDVEDALTRCAADESRRAMLAAQTDSARAADDLARTQYRAGLIPFSMVLTTEAALLSSEDTAAQNDSAAAQDMVALYKALGGGWSDTDTNSVQAAAR